MEKEIAPEKEQFEDLPQSLIEEIKAADRRMPLITARVDRDISRRAQAHFSKHRQPAWKSRPAWAAIAAMVLVAVLVTPFQDASPPDQSTVYADIDQSGRIDIADVLALARERQSGQGKQAELDAFAMRIVSLKSTGDRS
jgi:hypothetical protein